MLPLIEAYDLDEDAIEMEAKLARKTLGKKDNVNTIIDVISSRIPLKDAFPELKGHFSPKENQNLSTLYIE